MPASQTTLLIKYGMNESGLQPAMWRLHGTPSSPTHYTPFFGDEK